MPLNTHRTVDETHPLLENEYIDNFKTDAVRVVASGSVSNCTIVDTLASYEAHRDGIQLISPSPKGGHPNQQFALGKLSDVAIMGNTIRSKGYLQGVFSSDGLYDDLLIMENTIDTASQHKITINGLLGGVIEGNVDAKGYPVAVVLNPARVGGGLAGLPNIWISSFKGEDEYSPITGEGILDYRHKQLRKNDIYLENFDLTEFRKRVNSLLYENTLGFCGECQTLAKSHGRVIS